MKKFIRMLAVGVAMPAVFTTTIISSNTSLSKTPDTNKIGRPYIVKVVDAKGRLSNEIKGISNEVDPFLISQNLGANPHKEDKYAAFPNINMGIGSQITLYQAPDITIVDGKRKREVRSWQKNLDSLFSEQKIEIGKDDKVNFSLDTEVEDLMEIHITRVAVTTVVEHEPIKYSTVKKPNPNLEKGNKSVLQTGKNGTKNKFYEVRREDGEEVSRKLMKTEVAEEPTDQIEEVGTKVVVYGSGEASWYIKTGDMIGACNIVPRGTRLHVVNLSNGKSIDITSSGGGIQTSGRIVDLSTGAFQALGASLGQGTIGNVRVEKYYPTD